MNRAVAAEIRKLFTTRTGPVLTISSAVLCGLIALVIGLTTKQSDSGRDAVRGLVQTSALFGYVFSAIVGIIGLTGEYRHQTVTPTFLSTPVRSVVVGAKLVTYLVWGAVMGVLNLIVAFAVGYPLLRGRDIPGARLSAPGIHTAIGWEIVVVAIFAVIGVGLGALLRNQIAAIVGLLVYLFLVESVILAGILNNIAVVQHIRSYLPATLAGTLVGDNTVSAGVHLLHRGPAALILIAYGLAAAAGGAAITMRRDVT